MAIAFERRQSHGKKSRILQQQRCVANRINNRKFSLMVLFAPWPPKIVFLIFPDKFIDECGRIKKLAGNRLPPRKKKVYRRFLDVLNSLWGHNLSYKYLRLQYWFALGCCFAKCCHNNVMYLWLIVICRWL